MGEPSTAWVLRERCHMCGCRAARPRRRSDTCCGASRYGQARKRRRRQEGRSCAYDDDPTDWTKTIEVGQSMLGSAHRVYGRLSARVMDPTCSGGCYAGLSRAGAAVPTISAFILLSPLP